MISLSIDGLENGEKMNFHISVENKIKIYWPLPIPGPGVICGGVARVRLTQCAHCRYVLMWGPPGPDSPIRYPLACGENTRCRALPRVWELLVLAHRDGERQRNPAFHLMTCRRRCAFIYFFFSQKRGHLSLIVAGYRMWSRS